MIKRIYLYTTLIMFVLITTLKSYKMLQDISNVYFIQGDTHKMGKNNNKMGKNNNKMGKNNLKMGKNNLKMGKNNLKMGKNNHKMGILRKLITSFISFF